MYMELNICRHLVINCIFLGVNIACKWYQYYQCATKIMMPVRGKAASQRLLYV